MGWLPTQRRSHRSPSIWYSPWQPDVRPKCRAVCRWANSRVHPNTRRSWTFWSSLKWKTLEGITHLCGFILNFCFCCCFICYNSFWALSKWWHRIWSWAKSQSTWLQDCPDAVRCSVRLRTLVSTRVRSDWSCRFQRWTSWEYSGRTSPHPKHRP